MEQDHSPRVAVGATGAVWQQPTQTLRARDVPLLWGDLTSPRLRSAREGGEARTGGLRLVKLQEISRSGPLGTLAHHAARRGRGEDALCGYVQEGAGIF